MLVTTLHPVGARVSELALSHVTREHVDQLRHLLATHGVLVMPDQDVDDATFLDFLRQFGDLIFTKGEVPAPGFPDLNVISNVGRTTPPRSLFHVDSSYLRDPPSYTALRAVKVPVQGGQTQFTSQYRAFDTLPPVLRGRLEGRTITHVVTGLDVDPGDETSAEHPVFPAHPISGRTTIYLSTPARCAAISGLDEAEATDAVEFLYRHSTQENNVFQHSWAPGDVVMWDNLVVLHRADHASVVGDRVMHRGMVVGYDSLGPPTTEGVPRSRIPRAAPTGAA